MGLRSWGLRRDEKSPPDAGGEWDLEYYIPKFLTKKISRLSRERHVADLLYRDLLISLIF